VPQTIDSKMAYVKRIRFKAPAVGARSCNKVLGRRLEPVMKILIEVEKVEYRLWVRRQMLLRRPSRATPSKAGNSALWCHKNLAAMHGGGLDRLLPNGAVMG
jgi:hypothetical protein